MRHGIFAGLVLVSAFVTLPASASVMLLAVGTLTGSSAGNNVDLSGLTGTLEDGLPANILGGLGSGFAPMCDSSIGQPDNKSRALHFLAI